jgi:hypothetical protein
LLVKRRDEANVAQSLATFAIRMRMKYMTRIAYPRS